jgi:hypothetical protein
MPGGLRHVIRAAVAVFVIALAIPAAAVAGGGGKCNASACKVYVEPNGPSAGRGQTAQQPQGSGAGKKIHVPPKLSRVLAQAGRDRHPLEDLLAGSNVGSLRSGSNVGSPSALGAAFDLGAGPLALLLILLAIAVGLTARGSLRSWLRRRSSV